MATARLRIHLQEGQDCEVQGRSRFTQGIAQGGRHLNSIIACSCLAKVVGRHFLELIFDVLTHLLQGCHNKTLGQMLLFRLALLVRLVIQHPFLVGLRVYVFLVLLVCR